MNKVYKLVWSKVRRCYVVCSEIAKSHQSKKSVHDGRRILTKGAAIFLSFCLLSSSFSPTAYAAVKVLEDKYSHTVNKSGDTYTVSNQRVGGKDALNFFEEFSIARPETANLMLGTADRQINMVRQHMDVQGIINAFKDGKIGGDVHFISPNGISIGKTGIINVGRLTLGTNSSPYVETINSIFKENKESFYHHTMQKWSEPVNDGGDSSVTIKGQINTIGDVAVTSVQNITVDSGKIRTNRDFSGITDGLSTDELRSKLVNLPEGKAVIAKELGNGNIVLETGKNLSVGGTAGDEATLASAGGKIVLNAISHDADLQADPKEVPPDGMISIKHAYIDSSSSNRKSGNIEVSAVRDVMGISRVDVDGSTLDASGKNKQASGDVTVRATSETQLYAWDIGDGAYAKVNMGKDKNVTSRNNLKGDNVNVSAYASTTGDIGRSSAERTEAELAAKIEKDGEENVALGLLKDMGGNLRAVVSATKIKAEADVDIENSNITALGSTEKDGSHGNLTVLSDARSKISPMTIGGVGYGVNVGISDVASHVTIDKSHIQVLNNTDITATGNNNVSLTMIELGLLDSMTRSSVNFSWAELNSDVKAQVGKEATVLSRSDVGVKAESVRTLSSSVSNGGTSDVIGVAVSVALADTKAEAKMDGKIYAGGNVNINAINTVGKSDSGIYTADTTKASTTSGESALAPTVNGGKKAASSVWNGLKKGVKKVAEKLKITSVQTDLTSGETAETPEESEAKKKPWNKLGINAATAILLSSNDATAAVTGKVRGIKDLSKENQIEGLVPFIASDTAGAKSLSVKADHISRSAAKTAAFQNRPPEGSDLDRKSFTVSAGVTYMGVKNHATAYISGDTKTTGNTEVKAETKMPWQMRSAGSSPSEIFMTTLFTAIDGTGTEIPSSLVDSWTQTSGDGESASGAASIGVVNYDNSAKAFIGAVMDEDTPTVDAGGDVDVKALTDVTTVNFSGSVKNILNKAPINIWSDRRNEIINTKYFNMDDKADKGLGGAALAVRQQNHTEAYIGKGSTVTSGKNTNVDAKTEAWNLAFGAAGGMAKSMALDATVSVNRIDSDTKAHIDGGATVDAGEDVVVKALDDSVTVNLAGAVGISEGTSVGATIGYNHIMRDTEAAVKGNVTAGDNVSVSAENGGEIVNVTAAGAVTYDNKKPDVPNGAGSSGFHEPHTETSESAELGNEGGLEDVASALLGDAADISASSDNAISEVAGSDGAMADNVGKSKGGAAISANVAVNRIHDNAKATIEKDKDAVSGPSITADSLRVTSLNDSKIIATSAAISASLNASSKQAIAGSFMYNAITAENEAHVKDAALTLVGNKEKQDGVDIDESLTVEAKNDEHIVNIAASGSGASKGNAGAGQISLNWVDDRNESLVEKSTIKAGEKVTVRSSNEGEIDSYTGAVAASMGGTGNAVGASIAVNLIDGDTTSRMKDSSVQGMNETDRGGELSVSAEEKSDITSIVASGAAGKGFAGAFSASGNRVNASAKAEMMTNRAVDVGTLSIDAKNHGATTIGTGSLSLSSKNAAGAAIGVLVGKTSASATLQGDGKKEQKISAHGISVTADNAYNGDASDADGDNKAKNVAIGAAGGAGAFAGSGSITVNVLSQKTDAAIGAGSYDAGQGNVLVSAKSKAHMLGLAGGISVSKGTGIGAAIDVSHYTGHTYAEIRDGALVQHATKTDVSAVSEEELKSIAATLAGGSFGGAGAAGAHSVQTDTKAYIGNDKDSDTDAAPSLVGAGEITVHALDVTKLGTGAGSGGVGKSAGVGLTAAVETVDKTVSAYVGNKASIDGKSLSVNAENRSESTTAAAGLGAGGTAGVAGAVAETFTNHVTKAYVGKGASVTTTGKANIDATSTFKQDSGVGSVGAGADAGVGIGNSTVSFHGDTKAFIADNASLSAQGITVDADHTSDLLYATIAGGLSGGGSVSGAVGVNVIETKTQAYTGNSTTLLDTAEEKDAGITIRAQDTTKLRGGNGGLAIGAAGGGAGAAVAVTNIKKDTQAYIGKAAHLDTKGTLSLTAKSSENLFNLSLQGSGGLFAGLAGAVNVTNLTAVTKAYTNTGVEVNTKEGYTMKGKDMTLSASHEIERLDSTVVGAAGGAGAIGAAIDVGIVDTQTNSYVGDGNIIHTQGTVAVQAEDNGHDIKTRPLAAAVGGIGLSGSISVYHFGGTLSDEDRENLTGKTKEDGKYEGYDTWASAMINDHSSGKAFQNYNSESLTGIKEKLGEDFSAKAPDTLGEEGTLAKIGNGSVIAAKGGVTVTATDTLKIQTEMGNLSGGAAAAGASVSSVKTDKNVKALIDRAAQIDTEGTLSVKAKDDHSMTSYIVGASVAGGLAVQGTVATWKDHTDVHALIGDTNGISAKKLAVQAENDRTYDTTLVGASVALVGAVNGAVVTGSASGITEAGIGDETGTYDKDILVTEDAQVLSSAKTNLKAHVTGAAKGTYAGTGTGAVLTSDVDTKSFIGKGEKISAKNINVTANNTPTLKAMANAAGVGLAGVGITVAQTKALDDSRVLIGSGTSLTAAKTLELSARESRPTDKGYTALSQAIAGSGGVLAGSVAVSKAETKQITETMVGKNVTLKGDTIKVQAVHDDIVNTKMDAVSAGMYSGAGGDIRTNIDSAVSVKIEDGTTLASNHETMLLAKNESEKSWREGDEGPNGLSIGASLASGNGVVSHTTVHHGTNVDVGRASFTANGPVLTDERGKVDERDKMALTIDAQSKITSKDEESLTTGAAIAAAHVRNTNEAAAETTVTIGEGAVLRAGDTEGIKKKGEDRLEAGKSGIIASAFSGGSIGIGARNDADLVSSTLVDVFGAGGYAGSSNDVTYTGRTKTTFKGQAETAKGDIRIVAGRDAKGELGLLKVMGTSDILNATLIPISIAKDPRSIVTSNAELDLGKTAAVKSDRDAYLGAHSGMISQSASGEIKDWVNAVGEAFGSEGSKIGKNETYANSEANLSGSVQSGIHRNRSILFWGEPEKDKAGHMTGKWILYTDKDGEVTYTISSEVPVGTNLWKRLKELEGLRGDEAAEAAYDAERKFIQSKLVEQGLAYFEGKQFVEIPYDSIAEYTVMKNKMTDGSAYLIEQQNLQSKYEKEKNSLTDQYQVLNGVKSALLEWKESWDQRVKATEIVDAKEMDLTSKKAAVEEAIGESGETFDSYIEKNPEAEVVVTYKTSLEELEAAKSSLESAKTRCTDTAAVYETAADDYNRAYEAELPKTLNTLTDEVFENISKDLDGGLGILSEKKESYNKSLILMEENLSYQKGQIAATDDFFKKGGIEKNMVFYLSGKAIDTYEYGGKTYTLLHKQKVERTTHDLMVGNLIAQLGDIHLEGDTLYGTGMLSAPGTAAVNITNRTPYNLKVQDVIVGGKGGAEVVGTGGMIYRNGRILSGKTTQALKDEIQNVNTDKTKAVAMTIESGDSSGTNPSVIIQNDFAPANYQFEGSTQTAFTAPELHTQGVVYNPRGSVTVTSRAGDVYNEGSLHGGTIQVSATSGDYIQSYNPGYRMSNIGGAPLDDRGRLTGAKGAGILANGNILISARYVNINSTIQSGIAQWDYVIPKDFTLQYRDANGKLHTKVTTEDAKRLGDQYTYVVTGKKGEPINLSGDKSSTDRTGESLTYDPRTDRVVLSGVEVRGGYVSIVGTIINTAQDGATTGKIKALDGYGAIKVDNQSEKTLEIRGLNTGNGINGRIELIDLDKNDGSVRKRVNYVRRSDGIYKSTDGKNYEKVTGASETSYQTDKKMFYTYQTGQDSTEVNKYSYEGTKLDWFGIEDKTPTKEELLAAGGQQIEHKPGEERPLNGGSYVSTRNDLFWLFSNDDYYRTSEFTYTTDSHYDTHVKDKRLLYTLGLAKKYIVNMTETLGKKTIRQFSVKADNPVGISFFGNKEGGKLDVKGGAGDVIIAGAVHNGKGSTNLSGKNLIQGQNGFIDAKSLNLTATEHAGTKEGAIRTNAGTLSGTAGGNFAVSAEKGILITGNIKAGATVTLTAAEGLSQKEGTLVEGHRIELDAGSGAITTDAGGAFAIAAGKPSREGRDPSYGLKAAARGNIDIVNRTSDLYLDSVHSDQGDVSLVTQGSFVDNNFTDMDNTTARQKLEGWARKAVLENADETVKKQKRLLISKVEAKYNEYQSLKDMAVDGVITLDEGTQETLRHHGIDAETYRAEKQARYDALKDVVGTWTKGDVERYIADIETSTDQTLYGNADLKAEALQGDRFLTAGEKAEALVGSAKSAKDLLVTFVPGGIKEGITDTKASIKGTPHVTGRNVTLASLGTDGVMGSGNIGEKKTDMTIDLSKNHIMDLTSEELVALAAAERGDFKVEDGGDQVKLSTVKAITTDADGVLSAIAPNGSIYLIGKHGIKEGSSFHAGDEVRLKVDGDMKNIHVGSGTQTVLESASGSISGVEILGSGVLTARALKDVDIHKTGDLTIHTVYAADGDVTIALEKGSLYAENGQEGTGSEDARQNVHIEGNTITVTGAQSVEGKEPHDSVGMKAQKGSLHVETEKAKITLFGDVHQEDATISADELDLTVLGDVSAGTYEGKTKFTLQNEKKDGLEGTISGGTYGSDEDLEVHNESVIRGGSFISEEDLNLHNNGELKESTFMAKELGIVNKAEMKGNDLAARSLTITNQGTMTQDALVAMESMSLVNEGSMDDIHAKAAAVDIQNQGGTMIHSKVEAEGDLSYEDTNKVDPDQMASLIDSTLMSHTGDVLMGLSEEGKDGDLSGIVEDVTLSAGNDVRINSRNDVDATKVQTGRDAHMKSHGELRVDEVTADGKATLESGSTMTVHSLSTGTDAMFQSDGDLEVKTLHAENGNTKLLSGKSMAVENLKAGKDAVLESNDAMTIDMLETGGNATLQSDSTMEVTMLNAEEGSAELTSRGSMTVERLKTGKDSSLTGGGDVVIHHGEAGGRLTVQSEKSVAMEKLTSESLSIDAEKDITVMGSDSGIHTGDVSLTAGEDILLVKGRGSVKLEGADPDMTANDTDGSGQAGSIFRVDGSGSGYVLPEDTGVHITSRTGNVHMNGRRIALDTLVSERDMDVSLKADQIGIDHVESRGATDITITGREKEQAGFAGIHGVSKPLTLLDSKVQHLNLTGSDDLILKNVDLGGDSLIATRFIHVTMEKQGPVSMAEHVGYMKLSGRNMDTDHLTGIVRDGKTIDGSYLTKTGQSLLVKSLYQDQNLGEDGRRRESEENINYGIVEVEPVMEAEINQKAGQ